MNTPFDALTQAVIQFRDARDWAQFHTLKNLIVSLNLEASELLELTQWKTDEALHAELTSPKAREALEDECADVLLYLLLIAERAGINLEAAAYAKLDKNAQKYPVDQAYGSSEKYTAWENKDAPLASSSEATAEPTATPRPRLSFWKEF